MEPTERAVSLQTIENFLEEKKPSISVYALRPETLTTVTGWFLKRFNGEVLYSVKSNPDVEVLRYLYNVGVKHFDVASLKEVKLVKSLFPDASLYFMHPIKSREAIRVAYYDYGVKVFSLDSLDELQKILDVTNNAPDLSLHVRLAMLNSSCSFNLSSKFGAKLTEVKELLQQTRKASKEFGICFHVGSQCLSPDEYRKAVELVYYAILKAEVKIDVLDVGGGFPASYPGMIPPCLEEYMKTIDASFSKFKEDLNLPNCKLWCEPGRVLVADSGSLVVRVESRKDSRLYLNDGVYGGLFDAGFPAFIYPVRCYRLREKQEQVSSELVEYSFYGPTCDSLDVMKGPFLLPANIKEGDYIEVGQLGAYSKSIRTEFNGFDDYVQIEVSDKPLMKTVLE